MPIPVCAFYRIDATSLSTGRSAFQIRNAIREAAGAKPSVTGYSLQESFTGWFDTPKLLVVVALHDMIDTQNMVMFCAVNQYFAAQLEELKGREFSLLQDIHENMKELGSRLREEGLDKVKNMLRRINAMDTARRLQLASIILPGDEESATRALMQEVKARDAKVKLLETLAKQLRSLRFRPVRHAESLAEQNQRRRSSRVAPAVTSTATPTPQPMLPPRPTVGARMALESFGDKPAAEVAVIAKDPIVAAMSTLGIEHVSHHGIAKRRENLTTEQKAIFKDWFVAHLQHPYPAELEKQQLAARAGTTVERVTNWFINARARDLKHLLKPGDTIGTRYK